MRPAHQNSGSGKGRRNLIGFPHHKIATVPTGILSGLFLYVRYFDSPHKSEFIGEFASPEYPFSRGEGGRANARSEEEFGRRTAEQYELRTYSVVQHRNRYKLQHSTNIAARIPLQSRYARQLRTAKPPGGSGIMVRSTLLQTSQALCSSTSSAHFSPLKSKNHRGDSVVWIHVSAAMHRTVTRVRPPMVQVYKVRGYSLSRRYSS